MRRGDKVYVPNELLRLINHPPGSEVEGVALEERFVGVNGMIRRVIRCQFQMSAGWQVIQEIFADKVYFESEREAAIRVLGEDYA